LRPKASSTTKPIDLTPEFKPFADLLAEQPTEVRDLFRCTLVVRMIDDEKARATIQ
jgi:hypothetical protein